MPLNLVDIKRNEALFLLSESVRNLERIRDLICDDKITVKDIDLGLDFDMLKEIKYKTESIYDEVKDPISGEKIYLMQECYYSSITLDYYTNFSNVIKHHKEDGYTEEEIKQFNKDLVIYYTQFPGEGEIFE